MTKPNRKRLILIIDLSIFQLTLSNATKYSYVVGGGGGVLVTTLSKTV